MTRGDGRARSDGRHSHDDRSPATDAVPPMAGLVRPGDAANRRRRLVGLLVVLVLVWFLPWGMAVVAGWDAAALTFLVSIWPVIIRADGAHAAQLATREDETRGSAALLLVGASMASLLGVGLTLGPAGRQSGPLRVLLIGVAVLTVVLSWSVVNTVYTLRYADLHYRSQAGGIDFGDRGRPAPARLPRLRLRRLHDRHVLPGVGHHAARPPDPAHRALPCPPVVSCSAWSSSPAAINLVAGLLS